MPPFYPDVSDISPVARVRYVGIYPLLHQHFHVILGVKPAIRRQHPFLEDILLLADGLEVNVLGRICRSRWTGMNFPWE